MPDLPVLVVVLMGCGGSKPAFLPSEEEMPAIEVPGWNGVVYPHMSVRAKIPLTYDQKKDFTGDMADVNAQIAAQSTAGAGFRLVAFNYPVTPGWMHEVPGMDMPFDQTKKGMLDMAPNSFGMMAFQQVDVPASPLETKVVSSEMSFEISMSLSNPRSKATGYEELYSKLKLLGDEGYSLAAVIDEPGKRMPGMLVASSIGDGIVKGFAEVGRTAGQLATGTWVPKAQPVVGTVTLVGQRVAGAAPRATTYIVQDVPIETTGHYISTNAHADQNAGQNAWPQNINATMPTLDATLEEHFGPKQCKLAAVYNPSIVDRMALSGHFKCLKACHLIFEPTDEPYAVCVVDTAIYIKYPTMSPVSDGVDYASYLSVIENFVAKGWELAAAIGMPDCAIKPGGSMFHGRGASTVKLLFQARSNQPGLVRPAVPASVAG